MTTSVRGRGMGVAALAVTLATVLLLALLTPASSPASGTVLGSSRALNDQRGPVAPVVSAPVAVRSVPETAAGTVPKWYNVTGASTGTPPADTHAATAAFDPADNVTVLFGGCTNAGAPTNETWIFSRGTWVNRTNPMDAPPARCGASMDFDVNMNGLLLFGGSGVLGDLADTWLYAGGIWTDLTWVSAAPPARQYAVMTFDPQPEENGSVLFGGALASGLTTNDTWVWESWSGWVDLHTSVAPPPVEQAGFAYSPTDGYALLYGGVVVCGLFCFGILNESWELYAGEWWPSAPSTTPGPRAGSAMGYDSALDATVLFGGLNGTFLDQNDTWQYAHGVWASLGVPQAPPVRSVAAFASDVGGAAAVLFGGTGVSSDFNDTWVLEFPMSLTVTTPPILETTAPSDVNASVAGGSPPYRAFLGYGDGTSAALAGAGPGFPTVHVFAAPGSVSFSLSVTDAVGVSGALVEPATSVLPGPAISFIPSPLGVDVGVPNHLGVNVDSPGTAPLTVSWVFGDGATASGGNVSHAYAAAGTFLVTANATDREGGTTSVSRAVTVATLPSVTAAGSLTAADVGAPVALFANVTGGTAPYTFAWSFGDGNGSGSPDPIHAFRSAGTYTIQVWANDSGGGSAHATVSVTITSLNVAPEGTPSWYWAALAALIIVGALGAGLLVLTLRRKPRP